MFWATASCVISLLIVALALYAARRYLAAVVALKRDHELKLQRLQLLLVAADETTARLEAAIRRAESLRLRPRGEALANMEALADSAALANPDSLADMAASLSSQATAPFTDIFEQDEKALSVARLTDQGLKPAEISKRLTLSIGEVELLLSLRPDRS